MQVPSEWEAALEAALARRGVCLVLGPVDVGKSSFCGLLAQRAARAGVRAAVVDGDTGQQDLGPPACVGWAWADPQASRLEALALAGLYFVGATSPLGHLLELVAGMATLVAQGHRQGAELVVADTTGLVSGPGLGLKWAKVSALRPQTVVALQQQWELEPVLAPYRTRELPQVIRLRPSPQAQARSALARTARREQMFARYFQQAREQALPWQQVAVEGLPLFAGHALPAGDRERLERALGSPVLHAEQGPAGALAIAAEAPRYELGEWRVVESRHFDRALVGLVDGAGVTVGAGILRGWPAEGGRFQVVTPAPVAQVRTLKLGFMRVDPSGRELGTVRW